MGFVVKDNPRRIDDAQATLELNGMQFFRVPWLRHDDTHLRRDAPSKGHEKYCQLTTNTATVTHLGALEGINQTAFADVREANDTDGDACLEEAKQRGCHARGEIHPLMEARRAKGSIGVVWRRCLSQAWAFSRGTKI